MADGRFRKLLKVCITTCVYSKVLQVPAVHSVYQVVHLQLVRKRLHSELCVCL